jgi:hypothetical protein
MRNAVLGDSLPRVSLVDTDTGDSDGPRGVAYGQPEVGVVGFLVLPELHVVDNLGEEAEHVGEHVLEAAQRGSDLRPATRQLGNQATRPPGKKRRETGKKRRGTGKKRRGQDGRAAEE